MYAGDRTPNLIATGARADLAAAPRIEVILSHRHTMEGEPVSSATDVTYRAMRGSFERVRQETTFLENAREGTPKPDFILDLDTAVDEHGKDSAFISGLTLMLIPAFISSDIVVDATLRTPDGETVSQHKASGEMKVIIHLLLFPVLPFLPLISPGDELVDDTFRDVLIPISRDLEEYLARE
jgi:hypothetical protein